MVGRPTGKCWLLVNMYEGPWCWTLASYIPWPRLRNQSVNFQSLRELSVAYPTSNHAIFIHFAWVFHVYQTIGWEMTGRCYSALWLEWPNKLAKVHSRWSVSFLWNTTCPLFSHCRPNHLQPSSKQFILKKTLTSVAILSPSSKWKTPPENITIGQSQSTIKSRKCSGNYSRRQSCNFVSLNKTFAYHHRWNSRLFYRHHRRMIHTFCRFLLLAFLENVQEWPRLTPSV